MKPYVMSRALVILIAILLALSGCSKGEVVQTELPTQIIEPTATTQPTAVPTATEMIIQPTAEPLPLACTIAFESTRDGNSEIYSMAADGSDLINLTNNEAYDREPYWSPDGGQIVFVSNLMVEGQEGGNYLFVMNSDGSELRQLSHENDSQQPYWSWDGKIITYSAWGDIYLIKADGSGESINLTNSPEKDEWPSLSPDGSQIAYLSERDGVRHIFIMNTDGSNPTQLTLEGNVNAVKWTVNGEIFAYWDQPQGICGNCVMSPDGSNLRDAGGKGGIRDYLPFKNAAGEKVELTSIDLIPGNEEIYIVDVNIPEVFINLTNDPATDRTPVWPADCVKEFVGEIPKTDERSGETGSIGNGGFTIGYAGDDTSSTTRSARFQQACVELGVDCPSGSMDGLLSNGADAIVVDSVYGVPSESPEAIKAVVAKGIPVILMDAELDIDGLISVTIDQDRWVHTSLRYMLDTIGGTGKVVIFDIAVGYQQTNTIQGILNGYPDITVVGYELGGDDYDPFWIKPRSADYLRTDPDIAAIWTNMNWEPMIQGVVDESGLPLGQLPTMNCEPSQFGLQRWSELLKRDPNFDCSVVGNPPSIGYGSAYLAYFLLNGSEVDPNALSGKYGNSLFVDLPGVHTDSLEESLNTNPNVDIDLPPWVIKEMWLK